ncbi:MAG: hypothetical protein ACYCVD_03690 [Desulfitobacteriaceae bacterium]
MMIENVRGLLDPVFADYRESLTRDIEINGYKCFWNLTHNDRSDLKPGQYILVDTKPIPHFERTISKETRAYWE